MSITVWNHISPRPSNPSLRFKTASENSNLPFHHVTYEELYGNLENSLENISRFLEVSIAPKKVDILKNSSDDLRQAVSNYDEVIERLSQSQFADLIPSD
ncbi:hypothetical protein [Hoeflea sp.]|uniref:hypothetical protein n=1 Tax=Hoeflea sp. TaxID=1940281 RepID=UPI003B019198